MGINKAQKFQDEFLAVDEKFHEMINVINDKEKNDIHIDEKTYQDFYTVIIDYAQFNRWMIKVFYNDFVGKENKIDTSKFNKHTDEEEKKIEEIKEKFYYSGYRGYIESSLYSVDKLLETLNTLHDGNKLHINEKTMNKCRKKIKLENSLETVAETVGTVFTKAIIPAVSKGTKLAKDGYYTGTDKIYEKIDKRQEELHREYKYKSTEILLRYYESEKVTGLNRIVIEDILIDRGAI